MYEAEKKEILHTADKLIQFGLIKLSAGNLSVRRGNHVIITPSGMDYEDLNERDVLVLDMEGNVVEGNHKPSLDSVGLLYIYANMPTVGALIHTHQVYATAVSLIDDRLPALLLTLANAVGGEVVVAPFAPAGKIETGEVIVENVTDKRAIILRQHGVITLGKTIKEALYAAVYLEDAAKSYFLAKSIGEPRLLDNDQIREAVNIFSGYVK